MLPSILAKQLEKGIGDYIETTFPMTNEPFKGSIQKLLETKDSVYHEPYVAVRLPFRVAEEMPTCFEAVHPAYLPYVHQQKAFERLTGNDGRSTLVATGTGSGKTECFLYPILEYCYRHRGERGIKALIIYPMNALASDQAKRIADLIWNSEELRGNVTAGMYVGGHDKKAGTMMTQSTVITDKVTMLNNPPDILLTNYKMLDYLLVRPSDADLWKDNRDPETLKYIAVDELHTFDGAQGTDLACLLRRLKSRLGIQPGYLCCIGTSATMGGEDSSDSIRTYASEIFGEPFEKDSVITEDRLTASEFFDGEEITDFGMPTAEQIRELENCIAQDDETAYLKSAVSAWLTDFAEDVATDEGRLSLGERLIHHSFAQSMITFMGGKYYQEAAIVDGLKTHYPALGELGDGHAALDAMFALISYARTGRAGSLRPFLTVQVQLWFRELRRFLGKVSADDVTYAIAHDLNAQQAKQYLPVVNCRDCGTTGWVSTMNEMQNVTQSNLDAFYNNYFKGDSSKIVMLFPYQGDEIPSGSMAARLCPDCLQLKTGEGAGTHCEKCGGETMPVYIPTNNTYGKNAEKHFSCPCCGSRSGLSLMGLRSATEISASISQLFASKFNDDKKTLAFSDNVQDAAHRAGFFNSRTWKFGLRGAIQRYVQDGGAGLPLEEFTKGFLAYWHGKMTDEQFIGFFIAPNMTWMRAYEDMLENRELKNTKSSRELMTNVEKRLAYEIMQEYGIQSKVGRTLEKSACSCLSFNEKQIEAVADNVRERVVNEMGVLADQPLESFRLMVIGFLDRMRTNGAFVDSVFASFVKSGNDYMLSNKHLKWLPGVHGGKNAPRFIAVPSATGGGKMGSFDVLSAKKYTEWIEDCINAARMTMMSSDTAAEINYLILQELVKAGVVSPMDSPPEYTAYGINKDRVYVTDKVVSYQCDTCGTTYNYAEENSAVWELAPCIRNTCSGMLEKKEDAALGYYGKLFSSGDLARINAREHTGLLERNDRENLEIDFKRNKEDHKLWDPNVLSCTPTLEMGIDIGDLSTVILCSMPPAQAQFLQRAGRAGRKDGNALTLAVASARPHDLYFYADPMDMIAGNVAAPKVFLKASAVLERQFVAYCMDSWVKKGVPEQAIPKKVGQCLSHLDSKPTDVFPFNFLHYVENNLTSRLNSFIQMFAEYLDDTAREELGVFARGNGLKESPMHVKVLEAFTGLKKQQDSLRKSIGQLKDMISDLKAKPKDSSYDEEIKELGYEQTALMNVLRELQDKDVFNFLSDEGLLPNYAFPEAGIILKAVLWRREEDEEETAETKTRKYDKKVYEYNRGASSAISEFAPNNSFYVNGRKLTIDQVDMTTAQPALWRLCPTCSHAQIEEPGKNTACCPQCGSPAWADAGQVRNMLKVSMVYSNMDYRNSAIDDESEDRSATFYKKQLLVDVDEEHDIASAYRMDNEEFPFAYEFVKKAILREINFGESDTVGEKLMVAGEEDVRKGFRICKYCGKVQPEKGKPVHTRFCKTQTNPSLLEESTDSYLFLFREFQTEILRLLIPATSLDSTSIKTESFVAAFMLGMKEYFGNVDHLRATVSEVPVPDADYRKRYLVIYDSVPGGTGYLKQLMHEKNALIEIFEKALNVMENCSCKDDPQKDGCYHCLYAYRQSQQIGSISRSTAVHMLKAILSGKDSIEKIDKLGNVAVNSLFDSELERRFIEALVSMGNDSRKISAANALVNDKPGFLLTVNGITWEIEPQRYLSTEDGVSVQCKPDFVFWPVSDVSKKPVAVFTDGFTYHKDSVASDTLKREAIRRSGKYRVWSFSYKDVQAVFVDEGSYATETLTPENMPSGKKMYTPMVNEGKAAAIIPAKMSAMELFLRYLYEENTEEVFQVQAQAYALSLLEPTKANNAMAFNDWNVMAVKIENEAVFRGKEFDFPGTMFGKWIPRTFNAQLKILAGIRAEELKGNKHAPVSVYAVLEDRHASRTDKYEEEWNGFWHFFNVMQFDPAFIGVSQNGLEQMTYLSLSVPSAPDTTPDLTESERDSWAEAFDMLFDEDAKKFAEKLRAKGIAPGEIGYEVVDEYDEVVATVELAWPEQKLGFLTECQLEDKGKLEKLGWRILTEDIEFDDSVFGGVADE